MNNIGYYVYRFLDKDGIVKYVGRTVDLYRRFLQHSHLTKDIVKIEYISCSSRADMAWKEIYYINYFYNEKSTNVSDVYQGPVTELNLTDHWKVFQKTMVAKIFDEDKMLEHIHFMEELTLPPNLKSLIHIFDHEKMNSIGEEKHALSKAWYTKYSNTSVIKQLKNHLINFYRNICKAPSKKCMWTTYEMYKKELPVKGIQKGYTAPSEDHLYFTDRHYLAYLCNNFFPRGYTNELYTADDYALGEIVYFIWRSAIRKGEEIWVYVPSSRMRDLLEQWIEENSIKEEAMT